MLRRICLRVVASACPIYQRLGGLVALEYSKLSILVLKSRTNAPVQSSYRADLIKLDVDHTVHKFKYK